MTNKQNIDEARIEYEAFPKSKWRKDFFSEDNGGYLVTSWERIAEAQRNFKEQQKFSKEHEICMIYAKSGLKIQHYKDEKADGTYDVVCNRQKGDLKRTQGSGNIMRYAKYAIREQGAEVILFEFVKWNSDFRKVVDELVRKGYHEYYYITGIEMPHRF